MMSGLNRQHADITANLVDLYVAARNDYRQGDGFQKSRDSLNKKVIEWIL